jgi:hypothetical protein
VAEPVKLETVRNAPNVRVVEALEQLLVRAKAGEVRGLVALVNVSPCVTHYAVGDTTFTDCIAAFEDWKFCELANRNLHRTGL